MSLLFPLGLAMLAGLLLPLLVHLARREEQQPTDFAALRWMTARLRPRQRLRFEEWLLLAARLLLVAVLALLLARPAFTGGDGGAPWLVVVPGADVSSAPDLPENAQRRWLAPGFPALDTPAPVQRVATASLLRELDAQLPAATAVTVLVPARIDGADGERPKLSRAVDWRIVPGRMAESAPADPVPFAPVVRHAGDDAAGLPYVRAALSAWTGTDEADIAEAQADVPADAHHLIWLAPGELPATVHSWVEAGGTALLSAETTWPLPKAGVPEWHDADGDPLAQSARLGGGRIVQLRRSMTAATMPALLQPSLPDQLRDLMQGAPPPPTIADATAYAPVTGGTTFAEASREPVTPLLWLLLGLFALERWLATSRREAAP